MKKKYRIAIAMLLVATVWISCADNTLEVKPNDTDFPFRLVFDTDEGGALASEEDYGLEIIFADYLGDVPTDDITLTYEIEAEDSFEGIVEIDKVVYEVEVGDCVYERELDFDGTKIFLKRDADLGTLPESFEVEFELPGEDDAEGGFTFTITSLQSNSKKIVLGTPNEFEFEVLDNDVAGEWELEFDSEEEFNEFKSVFGALNPDLEKLSYEEIAGSIKAEFEFGEMQFEIELLKEEEVCQDGETETESLVVEIEADYDAEGGELALEGSRLVVGDDGEIEDELDFILEGEYALDEDEETITFTVIKIVDEDHFEEGDELFAGRKSFRFKKD